MIDNASGVPPVYFVCHLFIFREQEGDYGKIRYGFGCGDNQQPLYIV